MKALVCALALTAACGAAAESFARTWTSADGKHTFEAELVAVKQGWARLRGDDGHEVSVPLARLSEADREFIQAFLAQPPAQVPQEDESAPKPPAPAADAVKLKAEVAWDSTTHMDVDGKELPPPLVVSILAGGEAAAKAVAFGFVATSQAQDGAGKALSLSQSGFMMNDPSKEFVLVDRDDEFFAKHPADGVRVPLSFVPPDQPIQKIALLQGTFKLRTGGTHQTVIAKGPFTEDAKPLADPALEAAQLVVRARSDDPNSVTLEIEGNREVVTRLTLTNPAGKELQNGYSTSTSGGSLMYTLFADEELPANAQVRIQLVTDAIVLDIPFKFENLAVPPPAKRGGGVSGQFGF